MRNSFSTVLVTTTVAVSTALPVQAATFDFSKLQLISTKPIAANSELSFFGSLDNNEGQTAFFNPDPNALDRGHSEISPNSGNFAPYYATGRNASPENSGATRAASLEEVTNFPNFFNYLNSNSIALNNIGFSYGQKSDRDFKEAWNLGEDKLGQDWLASPTSTIEERIYTANPDAVESYFSLGNTKIVDLGYTPFYVLFEYGETPALEDNIDLFYTEPVKATKVAGLDPLASGLADAFLQDVENNGGNVQLVLEDIAAEDGAFSFGNGFSILNFPLPLSVRAVSVPEPSTILGFLMLAVSGIFAYPKQQKKARNTLK
ncbi:PEP-CTERM sorting domain-containing protein [Halotia branconii]|uniref:PEP-CTERM sorting domain-containing protein n=1 Tax=Halotia branconii CENA392 TaxID=1539056 RepID=A0AAJ6NT27_9CYAN|nr:PEP-CTERM sorting domain-containing protein [Halotia branconii]WGV26203.1 PEP-CTERM sorting domain-containing protein [Halotia branconii CENA392]